MNNDYKPKLKIQPLFENAKIPTRSTQYSAGYDVYAYKVEQLYSMKFGVEEKITDYDFKLNNDKLILFPGDRALINTGIKATVDKDWEIQVRPRSGNALKKGLTILNSPGTIDGDYRGFIGCIIINTSKVSQVIKYGDAIAQIVPKRAEYLDIEVVEDLDNTERGTQGFGSTEGRK